MQIKVFQLDWNIKQGEHFCPKRQGNLGVDLALLRASYVSPGLPGWLRW